MKLLFGALAPVLALLYIIYRIDKYDREPARLLGKLFLFGALIAGPIILVENFLSTLNTVMGDLGNFYTAFVVAAFTEELFKWFVLKQFAYRDRAYNEYLDGIVYGVFISMGFAAIENVLYVVGNNEMSVALLRALTALPGHMLFGVAMGYYFSVMKFAGTKSLYQRALRQSLIAPIVLHGVYDYILMSQYKWLLALFIPYLIYMWQFGIRRIKRYHDASRQEHSQEA